MSLNLHLLLRPHTLAKKHWTNGASVCAHRFARPLSPQRNEADDRIRRNDLSL